MWRVQKFVQKIPNIGYQDGGDDVARVRGRSVAISLAGTRHPFTAHFYRSSSLLALQPRQPSSSPIHRDYNSKTASNQLCKNAKERRRRMNVGTSSSKIPHRTRWQLRWGGVASCKHLLLCTGHIPDIFCCCFFTVLFWICCFENINSG